MLDLPAIGERITTDHSDAIYGRLNREIPLMTTADQSSNSTTLADITGLTFAVVNGKQYVIEGVLWYSVSATNQGFQTGISCPAGDVLALVETYGVTAANVAAVSNLTSSGSATGGATAVGATPNRYRIEFTITYDCTADGTFAIQFRRGGTSGSTGATIHKGSVGTVLVSA